MARQGESGSAPSGAGLGLSRSVRWLKIILKHLLAPIGLALPRRGGLRVLFYHRVNDHPYAALGLVSRELTVPVAAFARQMGWLARRGMRSLTLTQAQEMLSGRAPVDPRAFLLTFDDAYADVLEHAAPILARHGFTAVLFPVSEMIGGNNSTWQMGDSPDLGRFMNAEELARWLQLGHEIGSHSRTHPILTELDDETLAQELAQSRAALQRRFGRGIRAIAYPGGNVDERVARACREAGYSLGFTTRSGASAPGSDPLRICRTEVSSSDTHTLFRLKMAGVFDWLGLRDTGTYRRILRMFHRLAEALGGVPREQPR